MNDSVPQGLTTLRQTLFLVSMPMFFISFALPVQSKALGASATEIGGLFSLFSLAILLMRPVIGVGVDRLGRRIFLLLATLFYIGACLGYAFAEGITAMYVGRFFQGLGAALLLITADTITADLSPETQRANAMGKNVEAQTRASVVGAAIGFGLVGAMPTGAWTLSFSIFAGAAVIAFIYAFVKLPETRPAAAATATSEVTLSARLKKLLALFVLFGLANALGMPIYMILLQDNYTTDPRTLSFAFLPSAFIFMFLPSRLGALADRYDPVLMLAGGLAFAACLYAALVFSSGFILVVILYSVSILGWAIVEPARKTLTADASDPMHYGRNFGLAEMAFGAGAVVGPLIGGYLYDNVSQVAPFAFNSIFLVLAVTVTLIVLRERRQDA